MSQSREHQELPGEHHHQRETIGWREYVPLPELGLPGIKAKVDTGARTSALHAVNIVYFSRHGQTWVRFDVWPRQRDHTITVTCEAPLHDERYVKDSGGKSTLRPIIHTKALLKGVEVELELSLISRDTMGFRMLIGRQAMRGRFLVDPGRSYLAGKPRRRKTKKKVRKATRKTR